MINSKFQAPNPKESQITKIQKNQVFGHLDIGNWDLFGIWILGFEIFY
jgi:hypothetical protein